MAGIDDREDMELPPGYVRQWPWRGWGVDAQAQRNVAATQVEPEAEQLCLFIAQEHAEREAAAVAKIMAAIDEDTADAIAALDAVSDKDLADAVVRGLQRAGVGRGDTDEDRSSRELWTAFEEAETPKGDPLSEAQPDTVAGWHAAGGRKDDTGKDPWRLFPWDAARAIVKVLGFGAAKYSERNWEKGMDWSRPFDACIRHLTAWWEGEKADPETGMSHLWHAGCCIVFLISYEIRGIGRDNRPR